MLFALTGGVFLQWLLGYHFGVAVGGGYIALFGTAIQTGAGGDEPADDASRRQYDEQPRVHL